MAFDHHIEADKVDNLGFFATFLRAPVVGSLMWVLGGDAAREKEELCQKTLSTTPVSRDGKQPQSILIKRPFHESEKLRRTGPSGSKRMPPRLIGSDISEIQAEAMVSESQNSSLANSERAVDLRRCTRSSRSLSWSDESGHDLVEFIGEDTFSSLVLVAVVWIVSVVLIFPFLVQIMGNHPTQPIDNRPQASMKEGNLSTKSQPTESAMRRTRSKKQNAHIFESPGIEDGAGSGTSRYLPKGLSGGHSGLRIPTQPFADGSPQGTPSFSPEWGWYINTTPPTPEMYQSQANKKQNKKQDKSEASQALPPPVSHHTAFAKSFKKAAGDTTNMGWPGVPL